MKVKNSIFFNEEFAPAFKKLLTFDFDAQTSIRLIKSVKVFDEQQYAVLTVRDNLIKQYSTKLEDGSNKIVNGEVYFNTPEDTKEFQTKFNDLLRDEFDIPLVAKLKLSDSHVISGAYLSALTDIIDMGDDVTDDTDTSGGV